MKDVLGQAISDHFYRRSSARLFVNTRWNHERGHESGREPDHESPEQAPQSDRSVMPLKKYFRTADEMPQLEWLALQHCRGRILDIGAGAGSHALLLQKMGLNVAALDISPLNAAVMKERGIKKVIRRDFFSLTPAPATNPKTTAAPYDTLLLLMNGIGLAGTMAGLRIFLRKARTLLHPEGALIFDTSDVAYLYKGSPPKHGPYYGEINFQYEYRRERSDWFKWLFIDKRTLRRIAKEEGWQMQLLFEDKFDQYLVRLTPLVDPSP